MLIIIRVLCSSETVKEMAPEAQPNKPATFRVIDELEIEGRAPLQIIEEGESPETPLQNSTWESNDTLQKMKRNPVVRIF